MSDSDCETYDTGTRTGTGVISICVEFVPSSISQFSAPHSPLGQSDVHFPAPAYSNPSFGMSSASNVSMPDHLKKKASSLYINKKEYREMVERRNKEIREAFAALKGATKVECINCYRATIYTAI